MKYTFKFFIENYRKKPQNTEGGDARYLKNFGKSVILLLLLIVISCNSESETIKLTSDERYRVDTTVNSALAKMSVDLEKWCKDTTPILRKYYTDSLAIVREQEVLKQMPLQTY